MVCRRYQRLPLFTEIVEILCIVHNVVSMSTDHKRVWKITLYRISSMHIMHKHITKVSKYINKRIITKCNVVLLHRRLWMSQRRVIDVFTGIHTRINRLLILKSHYTSTGFHLCIRKTQIQKVNTTNKWRTFKM